MADLTGQTPAATYKGLLQVNDYTNGVDATSKYIQDGEGTDSALSVSTTKVGVGTDSPLSNFVIKGGTTSTATTFEVTCNDSDALIDALQRGNSNTPSPLKFTAEKYAFEGSTGGSGGDGNVGIGTDNPASGIKLHLSTASDADRYVVTRFSADTQQFDVGVGGSNVVIPGLRNKFYIYDSTNPATRLVVDGDGNVGIGTTSPSALLEVGDGTGAKVIKIKSGGGSRGRRLGF